MAWTTQQEDQLFELVDCGLETHKIAKIIGRSYTSVYKKLTRSGYTTALFWVKKEKASKW